MAAFKHDAQWKVWVLTEDLEPGSSADAKPGKRNIDGSYTGIGTMTQKVHDFGLFAGADPDAVDPKIESGTAIICMFDQGSWLGLIVKECPAQEEE